MEPFFQLKSSNLQFWVGVGVHSSLNWADPNMLN